jgi:hypothetical protein
MISTNTLLQRIARAISTAPLGETYEDCLNNKAKAVILEVAKWLEEDNTLTGVRCAFMLEQQVEPKDYSMRTYD